MGTARSRSPSQRTKAFPCALPAQDSEWAKGEPLRDDVGKDEAEELAEAGAGPAEVERGALIDAASEVDLAADVLPYTISPEFIKVFR